MAAGFLTTDALVLRETRYKEADRILTLFTAKEGIITAKARGALRKTSRTGAATQQLIYSEMTMFTNKERLSVNEATIKEPFDGLRRNFENFALGCYFSDLVEALLPENVPEPEALQLILNSLYALSYEMYSPIQIKAAFELRLMCLLGYAPDLFSCCVCGKEQLERPFLGIETGRICCHGCRNANIGASVELGDDVLKAMRHISSVSAKRLFSFRLESEELKRLGRVCEDYLLLRAERKFSTLDYWKKSKL